MQTQSNTQVKNHAPVRRPRSPSVHKIRHSIPQEEKDQAIALFNSGESAKDVAKAYKIGVSTVYAIKRAKEKADAKKAARANRKTAAPTEPAKETPAPVEARSKNNDADLLETVKRQQQEIQRLKDLLLEALLK